MATLTGPLHSVTARGSFAQALIFEHRLGRPYVKRHQRPRNDRTPAEVGIRSVVSYVTKRWHTLTPDQQITWLAIPHERNLTAFLLSFRSNMNRWADTLTPLDAYADVPTAPWLPTITLAATGGPKRADLVIATPIPDAAWTERQPAGDVNVNWRRVASDADGSHLIVAADTGRLYTSADYGVTWTERQPAGNVNKNWYAAASDADGSNLIAAATTDRVYTSADYGVTWTERQPAGDVSKPWATAASSADGSRLLITANVGRAYTSADYGVTWTERQPAGDADKPWTTTASDATGARLLLAANGGRLYTSTDYGVTWTQRNPAGDANKTWYAAASDADGSHLIAAIYTKRLYTSANYGVTWTERQPAGNVDYNWSRVSSDATGTNLVAAALGGRLYTSHDSGATWTERRPAGDADKQWRATASNADGSRLVAAIHAGRLYTGLLTRPSAVLIFRDDSAITTPSRTICRAVVDLDSNGEATWTDWGQVGTAHARPGALPPGTYHYVALPFLPDGRAGPPTSDTTATVT